MAKATGQISIVDFNDAPSLTAFVTTTSPRQQTYDRTSGVYTPNWTSSTGPTLTPSLFVSTEGNVDMIASATVKWYDATAPTTPLTTTGAYTVSGSTLKISQNILTGTTYSKTFIAEIFWIYEDTETTLQIKSEFTFNRADNGASAISAVLSNDSDVIPTDSAGNGGNFNGANTTMTIYEGATDVSASWTVTASTPVGLTGSLSGKTYTVTAMSSDTAYIDLVASKTGYASITRRFALSKSKTGVAGTTPTLYRLNVSAAAIQKTIGGVYSPTTVTLTAKSQTGAAAMGTYNGRFTVEESADGVTFATPAKYTSSADQNSYTYTPAANIKAVRMRLYASGGTTNLLDEQVVPIVVDGATGATGTDAMFSSVWTPSGNVFKNDLSTSLSAQVDFYKGGTVLTSGVTYEWFIQKAGTADEGAGAGWLKLTTANQAANGVTGAVNGTTLTVVSSGVTNIAVFKAKSSYGGKGYFDSIIFYDQTDPFMVVVDSSNGNIFKNGEISSQLLCRLWQNSEEVDVKGTSATTGYKYTYTWTKYNKDGIQDTAFGTSGIKTGKWIDITNADVSQKAVFKVDVN